MVVLDFLKAADANETQKLINRWIESYGSLEGFSKIYYDALMLSCRDIRYDISKLQSHENLLKVIEDDRFFFRKSL